MKNVLHFPGRSTSDVRATSDAAEGAAWIQGLGDIQPDESVPDGLRVLVYCPAGDQEHLEDDQGLLAERLVRDAHGDLGELAAGLCLQLNMLRGHVFTDRGQEHIKHMRAALLQVADQLCHRLETDPEATLALGLPGAISRLLEKWHPSAEFHADFHCNRPQMRLGREVEETLYRVAQEALTNVATHATEASLVSVTLQYGVNDWEFMTIEDNGPGFDASLYAADAEVVGKRGIALMRERLAAIGGTLDVVTFQGFGTTVVVSREAP